MDSTAALYAFRPPSPVTGRSFLFPPSNPPKLRGSRFLTKRTAFSPAFSVVHMCSNLWPDFLVFDRAKVPAPWTAGRKDKPLPPFYPSWKVTGLLASQTHCPFSTNTSPGFLGTFLISSGCVSRETVCRFCSFFFFPCCLVRRTTFRAVKTASHWSRRRQGLLIGKRPPFPTPVWYLNLAPFLIVFCCLHPPIPFLECLLRASTLPFLPRPPMNVVQLGVPYPPLSVPPNSAVSFFTSLSATSWRPKLSPSWAFPWVTPRSALSVRVWPQKSSESAIFPFGRCHLGRRFVPPSGFTRDPFYLFRQTGKLRLYSPLFLQFPALAYMDLTFFPQFLLRCTQLEVWCLIKKLCTQGVFFYFPSLLIH